MSMLQKSRKQGASVVLYIVFGVLIAAFIVGINPGSQGESVGCSPGGNSIVTVDGSRVGKTAYLVAYSNRYIPEFMRMWNMKTQKEREYAAVELLIRRELLAQAAAERGLRVTDDMVMEEIKKGYFFVGGQRIPLEDNIFDRHEDGTKTWNLDKFKNWIGSLNVSRNSYLEEQARGMQAAMMQELMLASVRVSHEEARDAYIHSKTTVSYDLVAFRPADYRGAMKLTDADIARYLATHEDEVKARFKADERTYKDVKPQIKLRQIFIAKTEEDKPKPPEAPGTGSGSAAGSAAGSGSATGSAAAGAAAGSGSAVAAGSGSAAKTDEPKQDDKTAAKPAKKVGLPIEEAKAKLEAARTAIAANRKKFAEAAAELSTDDAQKANGGDLGWRTQDSPNLGDKALNDQVKALKVGEMALAVVPDKGVYLVRVEEQRPVGGAKDLTYDQVKMEIAAELAREEWSKEAAKRAALAALTTARAGTGKNLGDLYEESMDDKIRRTIEQQQRMPGGGMPDLEMGDEPMAWKPGDDAGSSGTAGSAGSGTTGVKPDAGSAKPDAGSAKPDAGSAKPDAGSAAGSGSGAPTTPPTGAPGTPAAPAIKDIEPTKDVLPVFGEIAKPSLKKHGPYPRVEQLPGLGKELVPVVFDEMTGGMLAKRVYEADGAFILVQVTAKGEASMDEFEKDAPALVGRMRMTRAAYLVEDWLKARCVALDKDGKITVPDEFKNPTPDEDKKPVMPYKTCMTFR
jgi:parvulin-like peptidyl-prolyl isomerase